MITAVHKFVHQPSHYEVPYTIDMPANASVLTTRMHKGVVTSWAIISGEPEEPVARKFILVLTGKPFELPRSAQFMETLVLQSGVVCHLFWLAELWPVVPVLATAEGTDD